MKRMYEKPMAYEEIFAAENYCTSACWAVACDVSSANNFEYYYTNSVYRWPGQYSDMLVKGYGGDPHAKDHCGKSTNQYITASNGTATAMHEHNTWSLGTLNCDLYTDSKYTKLKSYSAVHPGDRIYWTTTSGNKTWHHQGTVQNSYPGKPNHS